MQIVIELTAGNLDPDPCFTNEQSRLNAYVAAIQAGLPINFTTVIVSQTAPGPDDRDKLWVSVDNNGRILGLFTFSNGAWQTIAPVAPYLVPGEFRYFDPTFYTPSAPWYLADGSVIGVPDLRGRFIVAKGQRTAPAAQTFTMPDGSIVSRTDTNTNFTTGAIGGEETHVLTPRELAAHNHTPGTGSYFITLGTGPQATNAGGQAGEEATTSVVGNFDAHNNLPPYYALAIMQWRPDLA